MNKRKILQFITIFTLIISNLQCNKVIAEEENDDEIIVVSMGDSYSSGEGVEPFYDQELPISEKMYSQDWLSHRSQVSWGSRLIVNGQKMVRDENWYFVAMSGAVVDSIDCNGCNDNPDFIKKNDPENPRIKTYNYEGNNNNGVVIDQQINIIDTINKNYGEGSIDYVTLTIGGNDLGFTSVVSSSVLNMDENVIRYIMPSNSYIVSTILHHYFVPNGLQETISDSWDKFYNGEDADISVKDNLSRIYNLISDKAGKQANIIIVGYPTLFSGHVTGLISLNDASLINNAVSQFNYELEKIVNECKNEGLNISFVSVEDEFSGHEAYSYKDEYINRIIIPKTEQDLKNGFEFASAYSMHPNEKGIKVYADCVNEEISKIEKEKAKLEFTKKVFEASNIGLEGNGKVYDYNDGSLHLISNPKDAVLKLYKGIETSDLNMISESLNPTSEKLLKTVGGLVSSIVGNNVDLKGLLDEYVDVGEWEIIDYDVTYYEDDSSSFSSKLMELAPFIKTILASEADVHTTVRYYLNGELKEGKDYFHLRRYGLNNWRIDVDISDYLN